MVYTSQRTLMPDQYVSLHMIVREYAVTKCPIEKVLEHAMLLHNLSDEENQ